MSGPASIIEAGDSLIARSAMAFSFVGVTLLRLDVTLGCTRTRVAPLAARSSERLVSTASWPDVLEMAARFVPTTGLAACPRASFKLLSEPINFATAMGLSGIPHFENFAVMRNNAVQF
jgi:hypothetical protein